jgi:hypothetical protein
MKKLKTQNRTCTKNTPKCVVCQKRFIVSGHRLEIVCSLICLEILNETSAIIIKKQTHARPKRSANDMLATK